MKSKNWSHVRNTQGEKIYNRVKENNINNEVIGGLYTIALVFQHKLAGNCAKCCISAKENLVII